MTVKERGPSMPQNGPSRSDRINYESWSPQSNSSPEVTSSTCGPSSAAVGPVCGLLSAPSGSSTNGSSVISTGSSSWTFSSSTWKIEFLVIQLVQQYSGKSPFNYWMIPNSILFPQKFNKISEYEVTKCISEFKRLTSSRSLRRFILTVLCSYNTYLYII